MTHHLQEEASKMGDATIIGNTKVGGPLEAVRAVRRRERSCVPDAQRQADRGVDRGPDLFERRRRLMDDWSSLCRSIGSGDCAAPVSCVPGVVDSAATTGDRE